MSHKVQTITITGKYLRVDLFHFSLSWHSRKLQNGSILSAAPSRFEWPVCNSERHLCTQSLFYFILSLSRQQLFWLQTHFCNSSIPYSFAVISTDSYEKIGFGSTHKHTHCFSDCVGVLCSLHQFCLIPISYYVKMLTASPCREQCCADWLTEKSSAVRRTASSDTAELQSQCQPT